MTTAVTMMLQFESRRRHRRPGMGQTATQQEGHGKKGKNKTGYFHDGSFRFRFLYCTWHAKQERLREKNENSY